MTNFNDIYRKHYAEVLNYISFKVQNLQIAEEITDDTFLKVNNYLHTFDESKSKLTTWIRNISNTCISDYFRIDHTDHVVCVSDFNDAETGRETFQFLAPDKADQTIVSEEFNNNIASAFRQLKPKYRKVAILFFLREKNYNEIAEICELPMGSVKGMISRVRATLQTELKGEMALLMS